MRRRAAVAGLLGLASVPAGAERLAPRLAPGPGSGAVPPPAPAAATSPAPPAHAAFGPVRPPIKPPDIALVDADGRPIGLQALLAGQPTALQLMFTGCSATCPIQGAVFAETARRLRQQGIERDVRLVSFSIDALGDSPRALKSWLERHGQVPGWRAVVPRDPRGVDAMTGFLRAGRDGPDPHTGQVHVFDRTGRWVFKSADLPSAREIAGWLATSLRTA